VLRARRVFLVEDRGVYGAGIAMMVRHRLAARGVRLAGRAHLGRHGRSSAAIARRIRRSGADALVYGGLSDSGG
jgi:branched-chain amino acid transport system substrate-binding protein